MEFTSLPSIPALLAKKGHTRQQRNPELPNTFSIYLFQLEIHFINTASSWPSSLLVNDPSRPIAAGTFRFCQLQVSLIQDHFTICSLVGSERKAD